FCTTSELHRAEKCLCVPVKLMDFRDPALVDRWRLQLADAALTERARRQLTVEYGVVELIPQTPRIVPGKPIVSVVTGGLLATGGAVAGASLARFAPAASLATPGAGAADPGALATRPPPPRGAAPRALAPRAAPPPSP